MTSPKKKSSFLREIYDAYRSKNFQKIEQLVNNFTNSDKDLFTELNEQEWEKIDREEKTRQKRRRLTAIILIGILFVMILVVVAIIVLPPILNPKPTPPIPHVITITPTNTPSPTLTIEPPTETPTLTPEPTLTPTPIPDSAFLVNLMDIQPPLPQNYEQVWVLNDDSPTTKFSPTDGWVEYTYPTFDTQSEKFKCRGGKLETSGFSVEYEMDQAIPLDGWYEILVMDTPQYSQNLDMLYSVLVDGNPIEPVRGTKQVLVNTSKLQKQPVWLSLGFYELKAGNRIKIQAEIPTLLSDSYFAFDRVVIGRLLDGQISVLNELPLNQNLPLTVLMDDSQAKVRIFNGTNFVDTIPEWLSMESEQAWEKAFHYFETGWMNTLQVIWGPRGRVPAGKYQLFVRVPDTMATVSSAEYYIIINDVPVERIVPRLLNQSNYAGQWVSVGEYTLDAESSVQVVLEVKQEVSGQIGVDAVALVRVP